jgi:methylphosphotriester-DNA--protein-cysteine methyltransferase
MRWQTPIRTSPPGLWRDFSFRQLRDSKQDLRAVMAAVRLITTRQGQVTSTDLMRGQSLSQRQLERQFNEIVGLPPKRLARTVRFQAALTSIYANPRRQLTDIAYEHGYADQSHFINELKALYGKTPSRVRFEAGQELPAEFDVEFLQSNGNSSR